MRNMLFSEWRAMLKGLADEVTRGVSGPALLVEVSTVGDDGLSIRTPCCTGSIRLRGVRAALTLEPYVEVEGGTALYGPLSRVEAGLQDYKWVVKALHRCAAAVEDIVVWVEDCPCDRCSSTGRSCHQTCDHCNGAGYRNEPEAV